jgi:hypothetical protein
MVGDFNKSGVRIIVTNEGGISFVDGDSNYIAMGPR